MIRTLLAAMMIVGIFSASPVLAQKAAAPAATATASVTAPSTWINDNKSVLTIASIDAKNGIFKGTFVNNAPNTSCKGVPFDATGQISGKRIRFFVNFKNATDDCYTITLWRGHFAGTSMPTVYEYGYLGRGGGIKVVRGGETFKQQ